MNSLKGTYKDLRKKGFRKDTLRNIRSQATAFLDSDVLQKKKKQMSKNKHFKRFAPKKASKAAECSAILDDMDSYTPAEQAAAVIYARKQARKNPFAVCLCDVHEEAEDQLRDTLDEELAIRTAALSPKNLWGTWLELYNIMRLVDDLGWEDELPNYEAACQQAEALGLSYDDQMDLDKVEVTDPRAFDTMQQLFDSCRCEELNSVGVPLPRLVVQEIWHVQHEQTKAEYLLKRQELMAECDAYPIQQYSVPSQRVNMSSINGGFPLASQYNEFYLFHGTNDEVAEKITDSDFLIKTAADNGWTFGQGVYAAEFVNHAQMFAMMGNGFEGDEVTILVCRAFCGRIQDAGAWPNTGQPTLNVSDLEANISSGAYMSTTGSEWPQTNYRVHDFILPDDDQILPEFIVKCTFG